MAFVWPPFVTALLSVKVIASNSGFAISSFDCLLPPTTSPFLFKAVFTLLLPFLFAVLALLIHGAAAFASNPRGTPPPVLWDKVSTNWFATMPILMVLAYPTLARVAFQLFRCVKSGEGTSVLLLEASLTCYQPQHLGWAFAVGLPMLVLYAVGIPASVYFVLRRNDCEQVMQRWLAGELTSEQDRQVLYRYSFLVKGYRTGACQWEAVVMGRKAALLAVSVFFSDSPQVQITVSGERRGGCVLFCQQG